MWPEVTISHSHKSAHVLICWQMLLGLKTPINEYSNEAPLPGSNAALHTTYCYYQRVCHVQFANWVLLTIHLDILDAQRQPYLSAFK